MTVPAGPPARRGFSATRKKKPKSSEMPIADKRQVDRDLWEKRVEKPAGGIARHQRDRLRCEIRLATQRISCLGTSSCPQGRCKTS